MMNKEEIGMTEMLEHIYKKNWSVDGVKVGKATNIECALHYNGYPYLHIEIPLTNEAIDNLTEYAFYASIMEVDNGSNAF